MNNDENTDGSEKTRVFAKNLMRKGECEKLENSHADELYFERLLSDREYERLREVIDKDNVFYYQFPEKRNKGNRNIFNNIKDKTDLYFKTIQWDGHGRDKKDSLMSDPIPKNLNTIQPTDKMINLCYVHVYGGNVQFQTLSANSNFGEVFKKYNYHLSFPVENMSECRPFDVGSDKYKNVTWLRLYNKMRPLSLFFIGDSNTSLDIWKSRIKFTRYLEEFIFPRQESPSK